MGNFIVVAQMVSGIGVKYEYLILEPLSEHAKHVLLSNLIGAAQRDGVC
jgi:hypothetical protein